MNIVANIVEGLLRVTVLAINIALQLMPILVVMAIDRQRKQWRGWRYYALVFVISLLILGAWTAAVRLAK